jgi:hypothetical protein
MIAKFFAWFKDHWFLLLSLALLLFIAFYPKIPLAEIIPGYIVRVRLEDFFLAGVLLLFGVQWFRGKVSINTPITWLLVGYVVVNILSILSAIFFIKTVPMVPLHIGKMLLHFARRMEYFSIFFLFYNGVKSFRHVKMMLIGCMIMVLGVSAYGYGQKYLFWPVYSTMNREFSKGMRLVLTDHARVPSTFGGHYDMSAFMMFMLLMTLSLLYLSHNYKEKVVLIGIFVIGFWLLILGSSRSSFLSYLVGAGILILLIGIYKKSWWWAISRGFLLFIFSLGVMVTFGDLSSRFSQLGIVKQANSYLAAIQKPIVAQPSNSVKVEPVTETDQLPTPVQTPTPVPAATPRALPGDVYKDIPDQKTITASEGGKTVTKVIEVPRQFSDCTYVYGLSACIRFETLWPRAINGFIRNPIVGSGPSTLTKQVRDQFTEAESTDNDFLRTLGEVGLLGAITFYGPIALFVKRAVDVLASKPRALAAAVLFGTIAGSLGMFFNALYIDVFAASKVAFMYWSMLGMGFSVLELVRKNSPESPTTSPAKLKKKK